MELRRVEPVTQNLSLTLIVLKQPLQLQPKDKAMDSTKHQSEDAPIKNYLIDEKLLSATQTMKILSVSRAKFYTKVVKDPDFTQIVRPLCLIQNGLKQYRQTEIIAFIERKQEVH